MEELDGSDVVLYFVFDVCFYHIIFFFNRKVRKVLRKVRKVYILFKSNQTVQSDGLNVYVLIDTMHICSFLQIPCSLKQRLDFL